LSTSSVALVFSYGSLREEAVQISIFGRVVRTEPDELVDCIRTLIEVPTWHKAAAQGLTHYANIEYAPGSGNRVAGVVLELTDGEIAVCDAYEQDADYVRVVAILASGRSAWVYRSSRTIGGVEPGLPELTGGK
jgi:gamma-glutamylcyclotransferase (GGCT)/AIG2-like uncharacterized protein YtfP